MGTAEEKKGQQSTLMVWNVMILNMLNQMISGAMPILYPEIMDEFALSYSQLGLLRSANTFVTGVPQMFVGFLRRWTSGRILLGVGNLFNAVMNILAGLSRGFLQFFGFRILAGIGRSTQHPVVVSVLISATVPSKRGKMLGLNQSIASIAFTFTPLITAYLLTRMGWRPILALLSIPALVFSLILILYVRGSSYTETITKDVLSLTRLREAMRNRNVLSISILQSVMAFSIGVRAFLPIYFIDILGFTAEKSSLLYSILLSGGILGPFFWGNISDRMNRKSLIIGITAMSGLGYFLLNYVMGFWTLAVLLFVIGFMVQRVVVQSVLSDIVEMTQLDQIFGFHFTIEFIIASFSSALVGYIVEFYGFNWSFTHITAVTVVSLFPALFIQDTRNKDS